MLSILGYWAIILGTLEVQVVVVGCVTDLNNYQRQVLCSKSYTAYQAPAIHLKIASGLFRPM